MDAELTGPIARLLSSWFPRNSILRHVGSLHIFCFLFVLFFFLHPVPGVIFFSFDSKLLWEMVLEAMYLDGPGSSVLDLPARLSNDSWTFVQINTFLVYLITCTNLIVGELFYVHKYRPKMATVQKCFLQIFHCTFYLTIRLFCLI